MLSYKSEQIDNNADYTEIVDERFKTNNIFITFITPLDENKSAGYYLASDVIRSTNINYPTITLLKRKLYSLYNASIGVNVYKKGDFQVISIIANSIADKYTINKEEISSEIIDILLDCVFSPNIENGVFPKNEVNLKKQELIDEIDAVINDKRSYALTKAAEVVYKGEKAAFAAEGTKKSAENLDEKTTYERYEELLKSAYIKVIFSGNYISDCGKEKIINKIKSMERNSSGKPETEKSLIKETVSRVTERLDVTQSKTVMAFKYKNEDKFAVKLMGSIYGGTPFSKLFNNVREKLSLCYYCAVNVNSLKNTLIVDSGVEHENIEPSEKEILNQLEEIKCGHVTDDEISDTKRYVLNGLKTVYDSPSSLADWYIGESFNENVSSPMEFAENIKNIDKDRIVNAAQDLVLDTVYILTGKE